MSATSSSRPVPALYRDRDPGQGQPQRPPAWEPQGAPAPAARAEPLTPCPSPALAFPPAPPVPTDSSSCIPARGAAPRACATLRPPARRSQPPMPAVPGSSVHSHRLPPTPSSSLLIPQLCCAVPCRAVLLRTSLVPPKPRPGANGSPFPTPRGWQPRLAQPERFGAQAAGAEGSCISLLSAGAPMLPCPSRDAGQGAPRRRHGRSHLRASGPRCQAAAPGQGEARVGRCRLAAPRDCAGWGLGPGRLSHTHRLPLPARGQCLAPWAWPQRGPAVRGHPHPHRLMKPLRTQGTYLLPENPLAASVLGAGQRGGRTCFLAVRGRR